MTVVVPVFNRASLIERCLDSIYAQTYRPIHVIVVDNGSTDGTLQVVSEWADIHVDGEFSVSVLSDSRKGAPYARQTGLDHVETERVMFFDSDDAMRPECIGKAMEAWNESPQIDIVAWPVMIHYDSGARVTHPIQGDLLERHLVHGIMRTHGYAVKTEFIRRAGGWKGEFPVYNDYETGIRLLLSGPEVMSVADPLVDVYPQAESITGLRYSDKAGQWEKALDAIDGYISKSECRDALRLHDIVTYRRAILAASYAKEGCPGLAESLYDRALGEIPKEKRPLIRFAYHWTRLGMRGAFSIIGRFL